MANRKRRPRNFTLPDDFMDELKQAASERGTSTSQLVEEWCRQHLRVDAYLRARHERGGFAHCPLEDVMHNDFLRRRVSAVVNADDPGDAMDAEDDLNESIAEFVAEWEPK